MTPAAPAFLLQINIWEMVGRGGLLTLAVLAILLVFSVFSWAIIFSKWSTLRSARSADRRFLRAFRKANGLDAVMVASEQFKPAPLVSVFEFGYEEVHRQVKARGSVTNKISLERSLQLGTSEELIKLERNMSWLATTASVARLSVCSVRCWALFVRFRSSACRARPACARSAQASPTRSSPPP